MSVKAIDIYSGCGGVSCGLANAGFKVKAAIEIEKKAVDVYHAYPMLSRVDVLNEDIHDVTGQVLLRKAQIDRNELYLLAGCPPCQNFSRQNTKNKEKTPEERKELLFEFLRIIEEIYPPFILMENVQGITTEFNKTILDEYLDRLRNTEKSECQRYEVFARVLNAADYGVPQLRKRYVLHAVRADIFRELQTNGIEFGLPIATHNKNGTDGLRHWVTVAEAIGGLPEIVAGEHYPEINALNVHNHKCADLSDTNIERMEIIRANGGSRTGLPDRLVLECHKKVDEKGNIFGGRKDVYGIMDGNKPSPTITCGCLCYSKGRYGHYEQNRAISIREAARLQTFPDDFIFSNNLSEAALEIGNAVPVKLVEASAKTILNTINTLKRARRKNNT